ncbi:YggS family pyridoxal phosphate-dependent enzyme [Stenoxybacter acetivorans]|uniref:YggS family pyridoxal phosphate-dependent enzyme n=1 Tax=Stenoxybacter acetivorans TaxID=422441 RepID=UPI00055D7169|nr:YggS family pyridoxal phosphate-dependent enzyme [Stenoxybacter acetivorans]
MTIQSNHCLIANRRAVLAEIEAQRQSAAAQQPVQLIAVSKTFPDEDIRILAADGQRDFGENYIQEFAAKSEALADLPIVWHIIGQIQSNKSRVVAERAQWVHTIDRPKIAQRLNEQRPDNLPPLQVCIEINIGGEDNKHGIAPDEAELLALAQAIEALPKLTLRGLMCVAKAGSNQTELNQQFLRMSELLRSLQAAGLKVDVLSMGMSADMDTAIACGATHVRVGSAIFGSRATANNKETK